MDSIALNTIRTVLSGNLADLAALASHYRYSPLENKIENLQRQSAQCVAQVNFAFQIFAIASEDYEVLRNIITDGVTSDLLRLRRLYNYPASDAHAREICHEVSENLGKHVARLRAACAALRDETRGTPVLVNI
jgi:hypothetical protein